MKFGWTGRPEVFVGGREFHFFQFQRKLIFLFGLFCGGDGFAEAAGMPAIEGAANGLSHGLAAQVVRQHRGPRSCLQDRPMRAGIRDDREYHQKFAAAKQHKLTFNNHRRKVKSSPTTAARL